jgi:hypothetical protein
MSSPYLYRSFTDSLPPDSFFSSWRDVSQVSRLPSAPQNYSFSHGESTFISRFARREDSFNVTSKKRLCSAKNRRSAIENSRIPTGFQTIIPSENHFYR